MNVKFGVQHGTNIAFTRLKTKDYLKSIKYCEKEGYESVSVMDHLNSLPTNAEVVSCNIVLTVAASLTEKVRLSSMVSDPHSRHPSQIALDSLTLQCLSNNRFILGLGAGEGINLNDFGIEVPEELNSSHHWKLSVSEMLASTDASTAFANENVPEEVIESMMISGSSEDCIAQIEEYIEVADEHFAIQIFAFDNYFNIFELFTDKVYGYFKELK
ncbi:MAG: LLM class flavin-dependent oxidoreductase [Promethearchaeota archaeon]